MNRTAKTVAVLLLLAVLAFSVSGCATLAQRAAEMEQAPTAGDNFAPSNQDSPQ